MNILYKHRTRGKGAEYTHIRGMVDGFKTLGYRVDFVCPPLINSKSLNQYKTPIRNFVFKLISTRAPIIIYEFIAIFYGFISLFKCMKLLREKKYSFTYERSAYFEFSTFFIKRKFDTPLVLEVSGLLNNSDPEHNREVVMKSLGCYIEKKILSVSDVIIVVSTTLRDVLLRLGIEPKKIMVLPNAVNLSDFKNISGQDIRIKYGLEKKKVIGFVGSFAKWHGLEFLIESIEFLCSIRRDIHLLLIGDGNNRKNIEKLIIDKKLNCIVTMTGAVPHSKIPSYINAMDIGVMPNSNNFGSPLKVFEYMATAKPVVAANYRPIAEVIEHGVNGYLFEPGNKNKFIEYILKLIDNENLMKEIGQEGYKRVVEQHTWDKNCLKVVNHLKKQKH